MTDDENRKPLRIASTREHRDDGEIIRATEDGEVLFGKHGGRIPHLLQHSTPSHFANPRNINSLVFSPVLFSYDGVADVMSKAFKRKIPHAKILEEGLMAKFEVLS